MKRKFFSFSLMASVGLLAFSVVGCGQSYGSDFVAANVSLPYSELAMKVGETKQIKVSVEKKYANAKPKWISHNESIAFFRDDSLGYVTAVGQGETDVTVVIAGGFADCHVVVTAEGVDPDAKRFTMQSTMDVKIGQTMKLSYSVSPAGSTIDFSSSDETIAGVDANGRVTGYVEGTATITGVCSNGITQDCKVTVSKEEQGGDDDYSIGLPADVTGLTGTIKVGTPTILKDFMTGLLAKFNEKTKSNVVFETPQFEENKGTGNFPAGAEKGPDVFPFVSDQTMSFNSMGALASLEYDISTEYKNSMLDGAIEAATWNGNALGYPFAADNGVVMFYDKGVVKDPAEIDTVDKLFALAKSKTLKVAYDITNGFYGASLLHTFNHGESMFTLETTNTGSKSTSEFACDNGVNAMALAFRIMREPTWDVTIDRPGSSGILATIVDTSKVRDYKSVLDPAGRYGVAPLPYVDESRSERICAYLGYKFYGVNATRKGEQLELAQYVARFLVSEYAQHYRYVNEKTQPTLRKLQTICLDEPHIAALNAQKATPGATLLLSIFGGEYFNNTSETFTDLFNDYASEDAYIENREDFYDLLVALDNSWA